MSTRELTLNLRKRELRNDAGGHACWATVESSITMPAAKIAITVCDMWDDHWSRGAAERVAEMAPRMDQVLAHARSAGVQIVHTPSDTMEHYDGTPARARVLAAPPLSLPEDLEHADPPLPIDDSDGGSDTGEKPSHRAWRTQHPLLSIDQQRDGISDDGVEVYRYLRHLACRQIFIMGVHTNMCVLHRSFGIKQMVRWGMDIALVRDLTDTMYNPASSPYVSHEEGTRLVVEFIEAFWCPTVHSAGLCCPL